MKPVKLKVIRNKRERAEQRRIHRMMTADAKHIKTTMPDCDGYVLVAWDREGYSVPLWENRTRCMPSACIGEFVKRQIERAVHVDDAKDAILGPRPHDDA